MVNGGMKFKKSATLLELILVIVVLSLGIAPLMVLMADVVTKHARGEAYYRAVVLGEDLMEEIFSKRFDEKTVKTGGDWSVLGPDSGESSRSAYDDVDDFSGFSDNTGGYERKVSVNYLDPDSSAKKCLNGKVDNPLDCFKDDSSLNYKRVDVEVSHRLIGRINFSFVVSGNHE